MVFDKSELTDPAKAPYVTCARSGFKVPASECIIINGKYYWKKFADKDAKDVVPIKVSEGGK
jgi:hypothetical protein